MDSPVRLGVSPATATPKDFYSQRFWGLSFLCWNSGLHGLTPQLFLRAYPHWNVGCFGLLATTLPDLDCQPPPLCPSFLSPPLLPVWMNVSSLTPWLLDFHTVWFSGSSGFFFNLFLFFFLTWLFLSFGFVRKQSVHLHLGQNSTLFYFLNSKGKIWNMASCKL